MVMTAEERARGGVNLVQMAQDLEEGRPPRPDYTFLPGEITTTPATPEPDEQDTAEHDVPTTSGQSKEDLGTPAATTYAVPRMRLPVQVTMTPPDVIETPNAISSGAVGRPRAE